MVRETNKKDVFLDLDINNNRFDFSTSITDAMTQAEIEIDILNETIDSIKNLKPNCDKLDYILAASSGALCSVIDIFLVNKPKESHIGNITDKWFANRVMDFAKLYHHPDKKNFKSFESALRFLEEKFKVPYDQTGCGDAGKKIFDLNTKNHHFKALAHNPSLLGLFFSIINQFESYSHFVSDGKLHTLENGWKLQGTNIPSKLFFGFVNWFGHLISDVSGSISSAKSGSRGMGIPSPLWTWTNDIIAIKNRLNISVTETDKIINELALKVYKQGYDTRFQAAQAIPVFVNELITRFIYSIRRLFKYFSETPKTEYSFSLIWKKCEPFSNPTIKRMLTVAHGTFCLVDIGDAIGKSLVNTGGSYDAIELVLRLNVIGVTRFAISLYGETKRLVSYCNTKKNDADFASKELVIIKNYIEGLKILSQKYDDTELLTFIDDFQKSDAYILAFEKSVKLAKLRNVSENKILKNKSDIDRYFGRK